MKRNVLLGIRRIGVEMWLWFCALVITGSLILFIYGAGKGLLSYFS